MWWLWIWVEMGVVVVEMGVVIEMGGDIESIIYT